jgi:hypothetical protein
MKRFIMALALAYLQQLYRHFERACQHPYRTLIVAHLRALVDVVTVLIALGILTGVVRVAIHT